MYDPMHSHRHCEHFERRADASALHPQDGNYVWAHTDTDPRHVTAKVQSTSVFFPRQDLGSSAATAQCPSKPIVRMLLGNTSQT